MTRSQMLLGAAACAMAVGGHGAQADNDPSRTGGLPRGGEPVQLDPADFDTGRWTTA